jgi:hypothetical protein
MNVGARLLALARAAGARSIAVVGTSKNAGKSVDVAAICAALHAEGTLFALCSAGRDGETFDVVDGGPKPRFFLYPKTLVATARVLFPPDAAVEVLEETGERGALGPIVVARVSAPGYFEVAGPSSASALNRIATALGSRAEFVVIDGAIDRLAALRERDDAIVVAVGATAPTQTAAVDEVRALVARLRLPKPDADRPVLRIEGALTASHAERLAREGERRQVVVGDPTQVAFGGKTFLALASRLDLRCERTLRPIACTVAPSGPEGRYDAAGFLRSVAAATGLPTFDVFAGEEITSAR